MNKKDSLLLAVTVSVEKIIVLINCPWEVPKPVLNTKAKHPPSGAVFIKIKIINIIIFLVVEKINGNKN